ncbi:hypothetical protein RRG08_064927 [Elysia crispata]|uniref:Uncharacterized protein n=1 Tax=Elysia crispata TaxID=231223 RepID=A0AAE1CIZ8_9GAST|nr:hypothetical protein RRG08_064927 [Elysia crispata]
MCMLIGGRGLEVGGGEQSSDLSRSVPGRCVCAGGSMFTCCGLKKKEEEHHQLSIHTKHPSDGHTTRSMQPRTSKEQ